MIDEERIYYSKVLITSNEPVSGIEAFKSLYEELKIIYTQKEIEEIDNSVKYGTNITDVDFLDDNYYVKRLEALIKSAFYALYKKYGQIGNYYKNLYFLIKYIDEKAEEIKDFNKWHYIGIIKAQLSTYEILMLYYDCIWMKGETDKEYKEEFFRYATDYKLLSALEDNELIKPEHKILVEHTIDD